MNREVCLSIYARPAEDRVCRKKATREVKAARSELTARIVRLRSEKHAAERGNWGVMKRIGVWRGGKEEGGENENNQKGECKHKGNP